MYNISWVNVQMMLADSPRVLTEEEYKKSKKVKKEINSADEAKIALAKIFG